MVQRPDPAQPGAPDSKSSPYHKRLALAVSITSPAPLTTSAMTKPTRWSITNSIDPVAEHSTSYQSISGGNSSRCEKFWFSWLKKAPAPVPPIRPMSFSMRRASCGAKFNSASGTRSVTSLLPSKKPVSVNTVSATKIAPSAPTANPESSAELSTIVNRP